MAGRARAASEAEDSNKVAMTIRLPEEVHDALRAVAFARGGSLNDVVLRALADFLAAEGGRETVDALATRVRERYRVALDKLKDL